MGGWTFIGELLFAHLDGVGVSEKAFGAREGLHIVSEGHENPAADGLYAEAFDEVRSGKAATHARPSAGGKHVIAAAGVVAEGLRGPGADEYGADRVDFLQEPSGVLGKT